MIRLHIKIQGTVFHLDTVFSKQLILQRAVRKWEGPFFKCSLAHTCQFFRGMNHVNYTVNYVKLFPVWFAPLQYKIYLKTALVKNYSLVKNTETLSYAKGITSIHDRSVNLRAAGTAIDTLTAEGGPAFLEYVSRLGLVQEQDMVILSFRQHFYFEAEEFKRARTLVNLTELNKITTVKDFFRSCYLIMPRESNLLGRFIDNKDNGRYGLNSNSSAFTEGDYFDDIENAIFSRIPFINRLYSIMDSRPNAWMTKSSVSGLLLDYGFKVMDMTVLSGLTYFHAKKTRTA